MNVQIEPIPEGLGTPDGPTSYFDRWSEQKIEEQIEARKTLVRQVFDEAGTEYDMSNVTSLKGDSAAKLKQVRELNNDLDRLKAARLVPLPVNLKRSQAESGTGGSFHAAIQKAGWHPDTKSRVQVPADAVLFKALTVTGDIEDYAPRTVRSTVLGYDRRYLYPALRQVGVSPTDTSVSYIQQTARTLAATGDMIRAIDATSAKPESAMTVELATADLKQVAHRVSGIPNVAVRQPSFRTVIESDLRLGLSEALDAMVDTAITAASVPNASTGVGIAAKIRAAMTAVQAAGYSPDTVALSPLEAEQLDVALLATFNSTGTSPLWGLRPRISKALDFAIVFDSTAFATLYAGPVEFASFEENDGATNSTLVRAELNAVAVVDREDAACEVWQS